MRSRCAVLAAALAIVSAGCGESRVYGPGAGGKAKGAATGTAVATVRVSEVEYALRPRSARVARAGVIAFEVSNDGSVPHALQVEGPRGDLRTATIAPGTRTTIKFDLPAGTYKWYCPIADHQRRGMVGRVRVAE